MHTNKNDRSFSDKSPATPLAARDRRDFMIQSSALVGASALLVSGLNGSGLAAAVDPVEEFKLPELPYAYDALDQVIDQETMTIHHTKHHQAYINKLNEAVKAHQELAGRSLEDLIRNVESLPESARMAIRNHGGGHHNHSLFWQVMRPAQENNAPKGQFAEQLNSSFGSFEKFKEAFTKNALDQFGSGWSWLVVSKSKLELMKTPNQDSPLMAGKQPLLGIDVWEHAYYLKYQNRRPDYVAAWWQVVNWDAVASKLQA